MAQATAPRKGVKMAQATAQKMKRMFKCKPTNLNIMVDRGGDVIIPVPGGGSRSERRPGRLIKFKTHLYMSNNEKEIEEILDWAVEHPEDGIEEVVKETEEEKLQKAQEALNAQFEKVEELKRKAEENKEVVEIEGKCEEKCPHCDFVVKGVSIGAVKASLRAHMVRVHREAPVKRGVGRPKKK